MRKETQHLLLLLIGGAVLKISLDGTYLRYVKPALGPWLTVTGAVAVLLAAVLIVRSFATKPVDGAHDHQHMTGIAWLLLVPALVLLFAPPPVLSIGDQPVEALPVATIKVEKRDNIAPLPAGQPPLKLMDFVTRAIAAPQTLDGHEVTLTGFVFHQSESTYLARVFIWCCVADARSVVLKLDVDGSRYPAQDFADKQWVQVVASYVPDSVHGNGDDIPSVRVEDVTTIPEPADVYEH